MAKQDVCNDTGRDRRQYKISVYQEPVVPVRRRVQVMPVPVVDSIVVALAMIVIRHGVPGTDVPMFGLQGIREFIAVVSMRRRGRFVV